jgi:hypothetical protein
MHHYWCKDELIHKLYQTRFWRNCDHPHINRIYSPPPPPLKIYYNRNVMESRSEDVRVWFSIWNHLRHRSENFHICAGWYQSRWHLTSELALQTTTRRQCAWQCYSERRRNGCADKWQTCVQTFACDYCPVSRVLRFVFTLVQAAVTCRPPPNTRRLQM